MAAFNSFDRQNVDQLRAELSAVLERYGVDANLEFKLGSIRYSTNEVEVKLTAKICGAKSFATTMVEQKAARLGLQMVNFRGDRLVEYNSRAYKMPYIYIDGRTGERFKCTETVAIAKFKKV